MGARPISLPGRALAAQTRRARFWAGMRSDAASIATWLAVCGGLGWVLMRVVDQLAQMEAALVLAGRV